MPGRRAGEPASRRAGEPASRPGTRPAASPTRSQHDDVAPMLAYNRRTLGEVYRARGHRDPAWDADALAFLDALAVHFTYNSFDFPCQTTVGPGDLMKVSLDALAAGRRAVDAG